MTTITIEVEYWAGCMTDVELPEGKTKDDIDDWYIKWNTYTLYFKDGSSIEGDLTLQEVDTKRPIDVNFVELIDHDE